MNRRTFIPFVQSVYYPVHIYKVCKVQVYTMSDATLKGIPKERVEKAIRKTVGSHSTCGALYLAKRYIGRDVIVVILKGGEGNGQKED